MVFSAAKFIYTSVIDIKPNNWTFLPEFNG